MPPSSANDKRVNAKHTPSLEAVMMATHSVEMSELVQDFPEYVYACATAQARVRSVKHWCTSGVEEEFPLYAAALKEKQLLSSKTTGATSSIEAGWQYAPQLSAVISTRSVSEAIVQKRKIVITGGPGSGKSTMVGALERIGFAAVPEAAIECINELSTQMGVEAQKQWRAAHKDEFQMMVARRQLVLEEEVDPDAEVIFFDRGRLDGHGYAKFFSQTLRQDLRELAEACEYQRVFVLDTLEEEVFAARGSDGRTSQRAASVEIGAAIEQVYRDFKYKPERVPVLPLHKRVEYVLNCLGLRVGSALLSDLEHEIGSPRSPTKFTHPGAKIKRKYSLPGVDGIEYGGLASEPA